MHSGKQIGKRVRLTEYGETPEEAVEKFMRIEEFAVPGVQDLGPDEILLRVKSATVAWVDMLMTSGQYQHMAALPYTPGMEGSGVVEAVGRNVDAAQCAPGDRVLTDFMQGGPRSLGPYQGSGTFATHIVLPAAAVYRIPGQLDFDQAAFLLSAYETAYHCLITRGQLRAGESVLIHGASGLTGLAAVQVAKLLGATVIATGRSDAKLETVRQHGADHVINVSPDQPGQTVRRFRDEVKALSGGEGVDVVYDGVGGDISLESLRCMAFGGRFLIVGWASTPNVARGKGQRGAPNANQLPTNLIQMKSLAVLGCPAVIAVAKDPSLRPPRLAQVLHWAETGAIKPFVSHAYPLEQYREAMLARWHGAVTGGCVINP